MGVTGLTTFISERSNLYLRKFELRDTYLVIDGCNFSTQFYKWHVPGYSAFGGDYDLLYYGLKEFFINLKKCNVTVIVINDGGHEERKLRTLHSRSEERLALLHNFQKKFWNGIFIPLFLHNVFLDVLNELEIIHFTCFFEADGEIAALARYLDCPVLSFDSDYYIYDVQYIAMDSLDIRPVKKSENDGDTSMYMNCMIFDVTNFLEDFKGLEKPVLPLLAALLGNDYVDKSVFRNFFNHMNILKSSKYSFNQMKILGTLNWLKTETVKSAKDCICSHLSGECVKKAMKAVNETIMNYQQRSPTILKYLNLKNVNVPKSDDGNENMKLKLPQKFIELYYKGELQRFMIDMLHLNHYYPQLQVEDVTKTTSHSISFPIIKAIYKILQSFGNKQGDLIIYVKVNRYFSKIRFKVSDDILSDVDINNIMNKENDVKFCLINNVLSLDESDVDVLSNFDDEWSIFITSMLYWMKNVKVTLSQLSAVILMALANFVQDSIGYYKNYSSFMRSKAGALNRSSKQDIHVTPLEKFSEIINSFSEFEKLTCTSIFIKLRQATPEITGNGYLIKTLHSFVMLQSCLYHMNELNSLLDKPFQKFLIHKFYSGTLLYNIHYLLNKKSDLRSYISLILSPVPNILNAYTFLIDRLSVYVLEKHEVERPTRPGNKKKSKKQRKKKKR